MRMASEKAVVAAGVAGLLLEDFESPGPIPESVSMLKGCANARLRGSQRRRRWLQRRLRSYQPVPSPGPEPG